MPTDIREDTELGLGHAHRWDNQCLLPLWVCHMLLIWQNNIFLGDSKQLLMQANSFSLSPVHNWKADASPLCAFRFPEKLRKSPENRQQTQSKGMFKVLTQITPTLNSSLFGLNMWKLTLS